MLLSLVTTSESFNLLLFEVLLPPPVLLSMVTTSENFNLTCLSQPCSCRRLKLIVRTKKNVLFWQQLPLHLSRALLLRPFVRKVAFALSFGKNDFFLHEYFTIGI